MASPSGWTSPTTECIGSSSSSAGPSGTSRNAPSVCWTERSRSTRPTSEPASRTGERANEPSSEAGKVKRGRGAKELQHVVFGIYERADGIVYVDLVEDASGAELKSALRENVSIETTVYSDTLSSYRGLDEEFAGHETISHRAGEYVRGSATINGIEGYWACAKERLLRPHGVADEHFLLYLKETEYRFNQEEFVNHLLEHVLLS